MRSRIVLVIVLLIAGLVAPSPMMGQRKSTEAQMSLRQKVDSELSNLVRNLDHAKSLPERLKVLEKSEHQIQNLRQKSARQDESDEIYFDKVLAGLGEIPHGETFQSEKCGDYKALLMAHLEPKALESGVKDPALKQTLSVLGSVCGKSL